MIPPGLNHAATLLFFVFDPLASLPIFILLTNRFDETDKIRSANRAVVVAGILFLIFVLIGNDLLALLGISAAGFKIAGGIVLLLMALEIIFGLNIVHPSEHNVAWVIIATPILTGPGVITTAIILAARYGHLITLVGGTFALLITWVLLRNAVLIIKVVGSNVIEISSKIIGLLIVAMAVEFILRGGIEYLQSFAGQPL